MADIVITPGSVIPSKKAKIKQGTSGAVITAGMPIYEDANQKVQISDANGSAAEQAVDGIALTGSSPNQPLLYATEDPELDLGTTVGLGGAAVLCLSATAGKIAPAADLTTGSRRVILGAGIGGSKVAFKPLKAGVV